MDGNSIAIKLNITARMEVQMNDPTEIKGYESFFGLFLMFVKIKVTFVIDFEHNKDGRQSRKNETSNQVSVSNINGGGSCDCGID